jgi:hypothetical protein
VSVLGNREAVRLDLPSKHWLRQGGILKTRGVMGSVRALKDALRGSKPRMHGFDAVWLSSCSRFKHCGIVPER